MDNRQEKSTTDQGVYTNKKLYVACFFLLLCASFQDAFVKTFYNVPHNVIEKTFNKSFCFSGETCDNKDGKLGVTLFWVSMVVSEGLGMVPAAITGRNLAEVLGRINHLALCLIPLIIALGLQIAASKFHLVYLLPFGRLFHSFGANWSLVTSALLSYGLLYPDVSPIHISLSIMLLSAVSMPVVQLVGTQFALGNELWGHVLILPGFTLLGMIVMLLFIHEPLIYLRKCERRRNANAMFHGGEGIVDKSVTRKAHDVSDWDQGRYFKVIKFIRKQQPEQMSAIKTVVVAEVALTIIMSNIVYLFSTSTLQQLGLPDLHAQLGTVGIFTVAPVFAAASIALVKYIRKRKSRLTLLCLSVMSMICMGSLTFLKEPYTGYGVIGCYVILVICYHFGVSTMALDVCGSKVLDVAQAPTMLMAMCTAKVVDVMVSSAFVLLSAYVHRSSAWLPSIFALVSCVIYLFFKLPKNREMKNLEEPKEDLHDKEHPSRKSSGPSLTSNYMKKRVQRAKSVPCREGHFDASATPESPKQLTEPRISTDVLNSIIASAQETHSVSDDNAQARRTPMIQWSDLIHEAQKKVEKKN